MISKIEKAIINSKYYNLIRYNKLSDLLVELKSNKTQNNVTFYSKFLDSSNPNKTIFDIGANKGNKVNAFLKMGFKVVALEPEKKSIETLKWRFGNNKNVTIVERGVSDSISELPVYITESRSGLNTLSEKWVKSIGDENENRWHSSQQYNVSYTIQTTTLDEIIKTYGVPYFIKIDVEGFELNVIKGLSSAPAFLSFECNLPEFMAETIEILHLLQKLSGKVQFQFSVDDAMVSNHWMNQEEILAIIGSGKYRYMEIICKF